MDAFPALLRDPDFVMVSHLLMSVSGRLPDA